MSATRYRQSIIVELDGANPAAVFNARLRLERALSGLSKELGNLKDSGNIIAVIPDKTIREHLAIPPAKAPG